MLFALSPFGLLERRCDNPASGGDIENPDRMHLAAFHLANGDEDPARGRINRAFQDWRVPTPDEDGLPPLQPGCIVPAYGERRDAVQRRLDRKDRAHKSAVA